MKKLLSAAAMLVPLLLLLGAVGSVRWWPGQAAPSVQVEAVARGQGALLAGAAEQSLQLPASVPLAGYARIDWKSQGVRDPVSVRALVLSETGCKVALVSVELLLVPASLTSEVRGRLADLGLDALILAATHTHTGPGGHWNNALAELATTGPYQPLVFDQLARSIADTVRRAHGALEPAALSVASSETPELTRNRNGGAIDGRMLRLRFSSARGPLAQVISYPAHPTLLGMEERRLSGDWPGELMRSQPFPTLFFQGVVGDQSVSIPPGVEPTPRGFAQALMASAERTPLSSETREPALAVATVSTSLPAPEPGALPPILRRLGANLLHWLVPGRSSVNALRLGPVLLLAVPAEPVAEVGRNWRGAAGSEAEVISLAGDYLGYVESARHPPEGGGETLRTFYGPALERWLDQALTAAVTAVDGQNGIGGAGR